jgi:hypothetical protein
MSTQLPDITARVRLDTTDLNKSVERAAKQGTKIGSALGSTVGTMAGIGLAAAGVAVTHFVGSSISAASDLSESLSKTKVVFGDLAPDVVAFAEDSAKSMGVSKQATLEATATLGNLFIALKIGQKPAADMSKQMVTLASDLASFNNVSPEEALLALRSGLVGETEPLRKFGVNMNDATLHTQALKLGLISNVKEALTPAAKAQAAYGLIMEQTTTAQGDFGRTSSGLANQQRILAAELENAKAKLGEQLMPAALATAKVFTEHVIPAIAATTEFLARNKDIIVPLVEVLGGMALAYLALTKAVKAYEAVKNLNPARLAMTVALTAATYLFAKAHAESARITAEAKKISDEYVKSLEFSTSSVTQNATALNFLKGKIDSQTKSALEAKDAHGVVSKEFVTQAKTVTNLSKTYDQQKAATDRLTANEKTLSAQYGISVDDVERLAKAQNVDLTGSADAVSNSFAKARKAVADTHNPTKQAAADMDTVKSSATTLNDAVKALNDSFDKLAGKTLSEHAALLNVNSGLISLKEALKESNGSLSVHTKTGIAANEAFDAQVKSIQALTSATYDNSGSLEKARAVLLAQIKVLEATAPKTQYTKQIIAELTQQYISMGAGATKGGNTAAAALTKTVSRSARDALAVGKTFDESMAQGIVSSQNVPIGKARAMVGGASKAAHIAADHDFYALGTNIDVSIAKGIADSQHLVSQGATNAMTAALSAAQRKIDAHSPSKEFMKLGKWSVEGFALGFSRNAHLATSASARMAGDAVTAAGIRPDAARYTATATTVTNSGGGLVAELRALRRELAQQTQVISGDGQRVGGALQGHAARTRHLARASV